MDGPLLQWCETCQEATETWLDFGHERCAKHEPPGDRALWDPDYQD